MHTEKSCFVHFTSDSYGTILNGATLMNIDINNIKNILIIQFRPFGDVLLNTSYFPALREQFPNAKIDFLVKKPYDAVLLNNRYIDEIIVFEQSKGIRYLFERVKLFRLINRRKYDLIIDQMRGTGSAQVVLFSSAKYRLGFRESRWSSIYNIKANTGKERYSASMKFDLLKPLGIKEHAYKLLYYVSPESLEYIDTWLESVKLNHKEFICIFPGSPVYKKRWKIENYATLADLILDNTNFKVVLNGAPNEYNDIIKMESLMRNIPIIAPQTNFNQAGALIKRSFLLVCNDSGVNHLSVALEVPSLAIFGNTNPINWAPTNFSAHYYLYNKDFDSSKDNSFGITPIMAFEKLRNIISNISIQKEM